MFGNTTLDLFVFENWTLKNRFEECGFLTEGLCVFWNKTYGNRTTMVTPYLNITSVYNNEKDQFNFYHS